jgi:poly(hydroxyalkanoate) granule-associated protein
MLLRTAGVRVVAEGLDRLPADGAFVYVSNHLSLADTPLMAGWLPTSFRFLAKESLMKVPIIGGHLRRGGHIPVERNDARAAVRSLARAEKLLRDVQARLHQGRPDVQEQAEKVTTRAQQSMEDFLNWLNIPSKRDIEDLSAKIAQLAVRVEELRKEP